MESLIFLIIFAFKVYYPNRKYEAIKEYNESKIGELIELYLQRPNKNHCAKHLKTYKIPFYSYLIALLLEIYLIYYQLKGINIGIKFLFWLVIVAVTIFSYYNNKIEGVNEFNITLQTELMKNLKYVLRKEEINYSYLSQSFIIERNNDEERIRAKNINDLNKVMRYFCRREIREQEKLGIVRKTELYQIKKIQEKWTQLWSD